METTAPPESATALENAPEVIEVWACPECGSWAGSSAMPDLGAVANVRSSMRNSATEPAKEWGKVTGPRSRCQHCRSRGMDVDRIKLAFVREDVMTRALERGVEALYQAEEKAANVKLQRPTPAAT